jgi:protein phosphatase 1L
MLTREQYAGLLFLSQDAEKAAKRLTDEAYGRGSNDNISCIVLKFNF